MKMTLITKIFPKRVFGTPLDDLFIKLHTMDFCFVVERVFFGNRWRVKA